MHHLRDVDVGVGVDVDMGVGVGGERIRNLGSQREFPNNIRNPLGGEDLRGPSLLGVITNRTTLVFQLT